MANQFIAIPAPAANGSGAAVDVSSFGALKTFQLASLGGAYVTLEMSNQAVATKWSPIKTFQAAGEETIVVAARWLRATTSNYQGGGAPVVNLGGDDSGAQFVELVAPAGNGEGVAVDVSALPAFMTVQVGGSFKGAINIEISEDAGATWSEMASFRGPGHQSFVAVAAQLRVKRNGIVFPNGPTPVVFVGATAPVGGGGGGGGGNSQVFLYTVTGLEPDPQNLTIPLPAPRANANYGVQVELGTFTNMLAHAVPDATKALNQFVLVLSGNATAGDTFQFSVEDF